MQLSGFRLDLMGTRPDEDGVLAYMSMLVDDALCVRNVKLVRINGRLIVAMPNRRVTAKCPCGEKNYLGAKFCNGCGKAIAPGTHADKAKHQDVVFPVHPQARALVDAAVREAFASETERLKADPSYVQDWRLRDFVKSLLTELLGRLPRDDQDADGAEHRDLIFPVGAAARRQVEQAVLEAYREEARRHRHPGYVPSWKAEQQAKRAA